MSVRHEVSFRGSVAFGVPDGGLDQIGIAVLDRHVAEIGLPLAADEADVVVLTERPTARTVEQLATKIRNASRPGVLAAGSGAAIDAAKLAALRASGSSSEPLTIVFVPCGAEPYRAFARFAVVDDGTERPTVVDPRFAEALVLILPEALAGLDDRLVAVGALDTLVHAIEALVNVGADALSRAYAQAAIRTIVQATDDARGDLVVAALLAVEAFSITRLGIAHAIASPLGTRCAITHDSINGVLAATVVSRWREEESIADIAGAFGVAPEADAVLSALDAYRERAGLPRNLEGLGVTVADIESVLPRAAKSSGISQLPREVSFDELRQLALSAFSGPHGKQEGLDGHS
jgi:alcohol dehydrogenase class IV